MSFFEIRLRNPQRRNNVVYYLAMIASHLFFCHGSPFIQSSRVPHTTTHLGEDSSDYAGDLIEISSVTTEMVSPPLVKRTDPPVIVTAFTDATVDLTVTVTVITTDVETGTVQIVVGPTGQPDTVGSVYTSLDTAGHSSQNPLLTNGISSPTSLISTASSMIVVSTYAPMPAVSSDIFEQPIATDAPPPSIGQRGDHPVPRLGIQQSAPISTNKFSQNFFLGTQGSGAWLHPYSISWAKGSGETTSWGMSVSHIDEDQLSFGAPDASGFVSYFTNPVGIDSLILSADELSYSTTLTTTDITDMSVVAQLRASPLDAPAIEFPLTPGTGFITGVYYGVTPVIQTGLSFLNITQVSAQPRLGVTKYVINLNDGITWYLYATSTDGSSLDLRIRDSNFMSAITPFTGTIQVAKDPNGAGEALYDATCGSYATGVSLSGTTSGIQGTYTFAFNKAGLDGAPLLMFALPHHVGSFDENTAAAVQYALQLRSTTKGNMTAVMADSWTMVEPALPITMSFLPWSSTQGTMSALSDAARATILEVAQSELSQDISAQSNLDSMYYSGKAFAKFAMILAVVYDMLGEASLAAAGLEKLEDAFELFANNSQIYPLVYDSAWGGVVSTASYTTGDSDIDFGNTYYNDHHFHYGYHVLAASVIAYLDPSWLTTHQDYINTLVRDYANPSPLDPYFPVSRNFDWYHGHSFAHGLFESADGRDQESSSEDVMSAYAIKMWGTVTGDSNMAARGDLMLAVQARSLDSYYLYTSDNTVEPTNFVGNKVGGIVFENKIDHTTYFGVNNEYIEGIQMLPLLPSTTYTRRGQFVSEEWAQYFSDGRADLAVGGWRGVLYGNLATIDPVTAYAWFTQPDFSSTYLDGGASLTWYLAYSAALGGL